MTCVTIEPTRDARLLAEIHAETVGFAYTGFFAADLEPPCADDLTRLWAERLADPTAGALVASDGKRPVGSVLTRLDPDFAGEGQLVGLHVLPAEWGVGVGSALHNAALIALAHDGYQIAGLWVIAANERARRMYETRGWRLVPRVNLEYLGVSEVRYRRELE
jgi:GNAT superfamily N-acetyltransferase